MLSERTEDRRRDGAGRGSLLQLSIMWLRYLISGVVISAASESEAPLLIQGARPESGAPSGRGHVTARAGALTGT